MPFKMLKKCEIKTIHWNKYNERSGKLPPRDI